MTWGVGDTARQGGVVWGGLQPTSQSVPSASPAPLMNAFSLNNGCLLEVQLQAHLLDRALQSPQALEQEENSGPLGSQSSSELTDGGGVTATC